MEFAGRGEKRGYPRREASFSILLPTFCRSLPKPSVVRQEFRATTAAAKASSVKADLLNGGECDGFIREMVVVRAAAREHPAQVSAAHLCSCCAPAPKAA